MPRHFEQYITTNDSPYNIANIEHLKCDTDDGAITVNLKYSQDARQQTHVIYNEGSSGNDITLGLERSGDTINGGTSVTIEDGEVWFLYAGDTEWNGYQIYPGQELSKNDVPEFDAIQFDLTPSLGGHSEGQLHWDDDIGTLELDMPGGNVHLQIGQELLIRVRNESGAQITNGTAVYISGGTSVYPKISVADVDGFAPSCVLGLATEDIDNNSYGYVAKAGLVREVDTSAFSVGDIVYLGENGIFATDAPVEPKYTVVLGHVVRDHATEGIVDVRVVKIPGLNNLSDVYDATSPSQSDQLYWDDTNSRWAIGPYIPYQNGFLSASLPPIEWDDATRKLTIGTPAVGGLDGTILSTQSGNLLAYWKLDEVSGTTADNAEGTATRDGTYTGVTVGESQTPFTAPRFDQVNDYVNVYSASLNSVWGWKQGTILAFAKVSAATEWNDTTYKWIAGFRDGSPGSQSIYQILKTNSANTLRFSLWLNGVSFYVDKTGVTTDAWFNVAMTWDDSDGNNRLRGYWNGSQEGTDVAINQTPTATTLETAYCNIGCLYNSPSVTWVWDGWLAHVAVWDKELTASEILAIYNAAGI